MRRLFVLFVLLISGLAQAGTNPFEAKPDFLPVGKAFIFTSERLESGETQLFWQIADGYYLYQKRLKFDGLPEQHKPVLPEGESHSDEFFGEQQVYRQGLELKLPAGASGQVKISYQGCADAGLCYPPQTRVVDLGNSNALSTANVKVTNAHDNVLTVLSSVGSRQTEIDALDTAGAASKLQEESYRSSIEDLDPYSAIAEFYQRQSSLQATQMTFAKLNSIALFNYL